MGEEQTTEGEKKEVSTNDIGEGDKSETVKETERIREETERLNKAIAEKENADARAKIAGVTDAGEQPPKEPEETPAEYAKRISGG